VGSVCFQLWTQNKLTRKKLAQLVKRKAFYSPVNLNLRQNQHSVGSSAVSFPSLFTPLAAIMTPAGE
jgi:hypothetical protein